MMVKRKALMIIASLFAFIFMNAQGVAFLNINPDPANMAMAGTSVAHRADAYAMENNIAATALDSPKIAAAVGFGIWQPGAANARLMSAQGFYRIGERFSVAFEYKGCSYSEYSVVSDDGRIKDAFTPKELTAGVGVAYRMADNFSAGLNIRMISSVMASDAKGSAFGADIAVKYYNNSLHAGLSVCNLGTKIKYGDVSYSLPMSAKLGVAYFVNNLMLSTEADYYLKKGLSAGLGAEYTFGNIVSLRAGYHFGKATGVLASYASAGIGIVAYGVKLDLAYITGSATLGNTLLLSLGYVL